MQACYLLIMEKCMCALGVCQQGGGVALSTWGLGQALLKKHGLGHPERWWWVG